MISTALILVHVSGLAIGAWCAWYLTAVRSYRSGLMDGIAMAERHLRNPQPNPVVTPPIGVGDCPEKTSIR